MTGRVTFPVRPRSGPEDEIEVLIAGETVAVWRDGRCISVIDRGHLRSWLADPTGPMGMGEVAFAVGRSSGLREALTITLPDVDTVTLAPRTVTELRNGL